MTPCAHAERHFVRVSYRVTGDSKPRFHVAEVCRACGANVRGTDWVPRSEVRAKGLSPELLPERRSAERQRSFFGR